MNLSALSSTGHPGFEGVPWEEEPALHHQVLLGNTAEMTMCTGFFIAGLTQKTWLPEG